MIKLPVVSISDKWILSSAMQKSVRRGNEAVAVSVALRLHAIDSKYLRRRLPVVALEDVGLGDIQTCIDVVEICATNQYWGSNSMHSLNFMVSAMSRAIKSRSACDAVCWSGVHPARKEIGNFLDPLGPMELVEIAADSDRPTIERIFAMRLFGEKLPAWIPSQGNDEHRRTLLSFLVSRLAVPRSIEYLVEHQQGTAGMAMMLPLMGNIAGKTCVRPGRRFPFSSELYGGVPLAALDQYTRLGRAVMAELYAQSPELQSFARYKIRSSKPLVAISLCLFQMDSACLDQMLTSTELEKLSTGSEEDELASVGVSHNDQVELRHLLISNASLLSAIRKQLLLRLDSEGPFDHQR